jgi:hypothetical protein
VTRIPQAQGVRRALRALRKATQVSLKELNKLAGQKMAKGEYDTAQQLAAHGTQIREFQTHVDDLHARWQQFGNGGGQSSQQPTTAQWMYYVPILQGLVKLGGQARRSEIEAQVEKTVGHTFQPGDRAGMARGRERWRLMIRKARRSLVSEGWVEGGVGPIWKITDAGRKTAENPPEFPK